MSSQILFLNTIRTSFFIRINKNTGRVTFFTVVVSSRVTASQAHGTMDLAAEVAQQ